MEDVDHHLGNNHPQELELVGWKRELSSMDGQVSGLHNRTETSAIMKKYFHISAIF